LDITAFIRELLFGHDCVIVPGFGGFIGNYTPARIDRTTSTFYPPVKQISFNRNLNHNDGLLVGRISESRGINYGDARALVEQFVEETRKRLSRGERVKFEHIGSFMNNHEGNVQFEPDRESNYHLNSYGLLPFQFHPLEEYDVRKRVTRHSGRQPVTSSVIRKYLWRAAIIIPIAGALATIPFTTGIFKGKTQQTALNPLSGIEFESSGVVTDKKPVYVSPEIILPVKDSVSDENKSAVEQLNPVAVAVQYHVITGSFKSESNASALIGKLSAEGYTPELLNGPNGFYRVSAIKCTSLSEALRKKESIGSKYSGSWIAKIF
jgi:nucleoid DNA-binding protein